MNNVHARETTTLLFVWLQNSNGFAVFFNIEGNIKTLSKALPESDSGSHLILFYKDSTSTTDSMWTQI